MDSASVDQLLSTTRAVRRRLDLEREVSPEIVLECLRLAIQAPTGGGRQGWRWVVVFDEDQRAALARVYRDASLERFAQAAEQADDPRIRRTYEAATSLALNLHRVPVLVVPCIEGRVESDNNHAAAGFYGSIFPAVWSFQLALRARGLGSCLTTVHLARAEEAATVLGIPSDYTQVALLPVAYTTGDDFRPAVRNPVEEIAHLDRWGNQPWGSSDLGARK